jgi:simple sugar transport system substrate-binding protein
VLQGINAFTRGARSVNPKAEVRVIWTSSWFDPGKERDATTTLISQNADVITQHTDSTAVVQTAEEKGKYAIGYHSDMSKYGPKAHLTRRRITGASTTRRLSAKSSAASGSPSSVWGGMKDGMIKLAPLNPAIPADVKTMVAALEGDIKSGKLHPFAGPVKDQDGKDRVPAGKNMTDEEMGKMDFYVEGVAGKLPAK